MRKIFKILFFAVLIIFINTISCFALNADVFMSSHDINKGDEVTLTVAFDNDVVATNFDISYDSEVFEFVKGVDINAAVKDGKIACIYADSTLQGKNSFTILFKSIAEKENAVFEIENAKVRQKDSDESITGSNISGLSTPVSVKIGEEPVIENEDANEIWKEYNGEENNVVNKTTPSKLPHTGNAFNVFIVILIISIIGAIIIGRKYSIYNKMFIMLPVILFVGLLLQNTKVFAIEATSTYVETYKNLIQNKNVLAIMLPNDTSKLNITKEELQELLSSKWEKESNITIKNNTENNPKVSTGMEITVNNEDYTVLLYGDANGDGDICDADDLMVVINDFLGKSKANDINFLAANLANQESLKQLDSDDLMQMINMYLGKLNGSLVKELPENDENLVVTISDSSHVGIGMGYSWIYNVYNDGTVKGEKWSSGSAVDFVSKKLKEYTTNISNDEVTFLKDLKNKESNNNSNENIFDWIYITTFYGSEIDFTKLNSEDINTLKGIIEKITDYRDIGIFSKVYYHPMEGAYVQTYYLVDIYEGKITYESSSKPVIPVPTCFSQKTSRDLTENEISYFKNVFQEMKKGKYNKPTDSQLKDYFDNKNPTLSFGYVYYDFAWADYDGPFTLYKDEDLNEFGTIINGMNELEGFTADAAPEVSETCSTNVNVYDLGKRIYLDQKGYDFVEYNNKYYMIISSGPQKKKIYVDYVIFEDDYVEVEIKETTNESENIVYPYVVIEFNKKINNIRLNDSSYSKVDLFNQVIPYAAKPVIYLYPEKECNINVKLGKPENITCTYPKYKDSWNVLAKPNGDLVDLSTGRKLYSLYWEGINTVKPNFETGFVVKGEDSAKFLEEKLDILGLNEKEAEEFIIYWLPKLEANSYNFIRFQSMEEINENMPLIITPEPETLIRVVMEWKGLDKPINVKEQSLQKVERKGYTAVEWGGTEIK